MKIILFASALALSTAAIAQDTTTPATPPATPDATAPATPDAATPPATPDAAATPAAGDTGTQPQASSTDDSNLPACSRSVTDKCVQKGGAGHKKAPHHKKK